MSDKRSADQMRRGQSENPDEISSDESVLDFLWDSEAAAAPTGEADMREGAEQDVAREGAEGEDLTGALARYDSWLNSLDGAP